MESIQIKILKGKDMASIPCNLIDRLFQEGNNLTFTLRHSPKPSSSSFYILGPRPRPSWSDEEELYPSDQPPPAYQDVMDGRIESHIVNPEMPPWMMVL